MVPPPATATRRQRLRVELEHGERTLAELRAARAERTSPRTLEDDLRHLERSLRHEGRRLAVAPARCLACDFVFRDRDGRRLNAPSRCPRCRSERIAEPRTDDRVAERGRRDGLAAGGSFAGRHRRLARPGD